MPHDYSYTEIRGIDGNLKEVVFMPSSIETIDQAIYAYINESLDLHASTAKGWKKIPVIWVSAERSHQIKDNKDLRDKSGVLKMPLITIERVSMEKDPAFKGTYQAHMPDHGKGLHKVRRVNTVAGQRINQKKTSNFKNAQSARKYGNVNNTLVGHGQENFPTRVNDKSRVVFQTIYQPIPIWVKTIYSVKIRTEYIQQMNELSQPFYTRTGQAMSFFITHDGHRYEGFVEGSIKQSNNSSNLGDEERIYQTEIDVKILGYLMGDGTNDDRPKITIVENFVDVKIPRERVIVGDINTFLDEIDEGKGFYRE
jgi:hypothetical protein